jgi:hypothetical protein
VLPSRDVRRWVRKDPTSRFARRAWYLYEVLTGDALDVPDIALAAYVDLIDPKLSSPVR